jgi:Mrp family chromosome partitioning ATPase/capsular polysaccharide biosynthesis protein
MPWPGRISFTCLGPARPELIEPSNIQTQTADWQLPGEAQQGLRRYVQTIRERWKLIALSVLVTTLAAALYVGTAQKTYKAESDLIITPIAGQDTTLNSIPGLIRESSDPTRNVQTAAKLVTTIDVARKAKAKLNTSRNARSLLNDVQAAPIAQSDLVAITATGSTAESAQNLANVFADSVVEDRTQKFHEQVDIRIKALKTQVAGLTEPAGSPTNPLRTQLSELETVRAGNDPTMRVDTRADEPISPAWPKRNLSIIAGIMAGLALGIGGAFAAQVFDPRLRREDQLRALYRLPILARIPVESRARSESAIAPHQLSPAGVEAYRTLRATLTAPRGKGELSRAVMITGASPSEGKTTTALNLAASLALAGKRVILIEADLRRPKVGKALGISATRGIASVLIDGLPLNEALLTSDAYGDNLKLLLVDRAGEWMADQFSLPAAQGLVDEAKEIADYVIIDSPPLAEVIDALPLVQMTDDVVIVTRLGRTHISRLQRLGEILAQYHVRPAGFAVVGVSPTTEYGYYTERPVRLSEEKRTPVLTR